MKNAVTSGWKEGRVKNYPFQGHRRKSNKESLPWLSCAQGPKRTFVGGELFLLCPVRWIFAVPPVPCEKASVALPFKP
jgi:hypothetical protein